MIVSKHCCKRFKSRFTNRALNEIEASISVAKIYKNSKLEKYSNNPKIAYFKSEIDNARLVIEMTKKVIITIYPLNSI